MKINSVPLIISLSISGLIAFGFYSFLQGTSTSNSLLTTTIFSFVFSAVTLSNILSINFETERITTIIRTVSGVFFTIGLGTLILLLVLTNSMPILVIVIGIILLVFISIVYSIAKSGQ